MIPEMNKLMKRKEMFNDSSTNRSLSGIRVIAFHKTAILYNRN